MITNCPRCNSVLVPSISQSDEYSTFFLECPHCNTFVNTWQPQPQQYEFLSDASRFKGNFGSYGSAKTSASIQNILKHIMLTPNGNGLVGASILPQLDQTIKREFDQLVPKAFIQYVHNQKNYYDFINGYRLLWRPMDDPGKLRSLNLDMIVFVEGSEINQDFWTSAKTRLRNMAASIKDEKATAEEIKKFTRRHRRNPSPSEIAHLTVYSADWREQWVESNPDAGWIKQDVLNVAHKVTLAGEPLYTPHSQADLLNLELDPATSAHIASTSANAYLPKDYIKNLSKNRPQWWVNRYVLSSFDYAEGLVFPSALKNARTETEHILTAAPQPPRNARYILVHDYGLSDPAGILLGYIDPDINKLVIYKEYKQNNNHIESLSLEIKKMASVVPQGAWLKPFIIDPKSGPKRDYKQQSLIDLYAEHGILFQPAGTPAVEPGIYKLNSFFEEDKILISPECRELIKELGEYSFKQSKDGGNTGKPEDRNNHLIDPLRWMVMELPRVSDDLLGAAFNSFGEQVGMSGYNALAPTAWDYEYIPLENKRFTNTEDSGIISLGNSWNPLYD